MTKTMFGIAIALLPFLAHAFPGMNGITLSSDADFIKISQELLYAAKTKAPTDSISKILEQVPEADLERQLTDDNRKKTFWINIYNAYTQIILSKDPDRYKKRSRFFGSRQIPIAGRMFSLDEIEHGLLRHSRIKWSLGHFGNPFPSSFEKRNRVGIVDYRIHFSLNCGAKSCPPIAFYTPEKLDQQLDVATKVYLKGETTYNPTHNEVTVPALMGWFRGDFGGKSGIRAILKKLALIPVDSHPSVHFATYNWSLQLENFKNE
jgi:Protein of unknown function, DUF547